jgi:hypothetical protein
MRTPARATCEPVGGSTTPHLTWPTPCLHVQVTFAYPGAAKPQLVDVTCTCRLSSRVAVLGPNGAGEWDAPHARRVLKVLHHGLVQGPGPGA